MSAAPVTDDGTTEDGAKLDWLPAGDKSYMMPGKEDGHCQQGNQAGSDKQTGPAAVTDDANIKMVPSTY